MVPGTVDVNVAFIAPHPIIDVPDEIVSLQARNPTSWPRARRVFRQGSRLKSQKFLHRLLLALLRSSLIPPNEVCRITFGLYYYTNCIYIEGQSGGADHLFDAMVEPHCVRQRD